MDGSNVEIVWKHRRSATVPLPGGSNTRCCQGCVHIAGTAFKEDARHELSGRHPEVWP